MKVYFTQILFFALLALNGKAQDAGQVSGKNSKSGVYLTYSDYKQDKLTYAVDCATKKQTIKLNDFLNQSFITVRYMGQKIELQKDSIYGILDCNTSLIRFRGKEHYRLAEKGPVWIFYKKVSPPQTKGSKMEKRYYFSTSGDGELTELTLNNIKRSFPNDRKLHGLMDVQFQEVDVSDYDPYHKMFRINYLLKDLKNDCVCPAHSYIRGKEDEKCPECERKLEKI